MPLWRSTAARSGSRRHERHECHEHHEHQEECNRTPEPERGGVVSGRGNGGRQIEGRTSTGVGSTVLRMTAVSKRYQRGAEQVTALDNIHLALQPGEMVALCGPSGSGKTTLINIIVGWEQPDAGAVVWSGKIAVPPTWQQIGVVPQRLGLLDDLTVEENLEIPGLLAEHPPDRVGMLARALDLVELFPRWPTQISMGQQQRVAVARALALDPVLAVFDEPTGHQDEASAERVVAVIRDARARGTTSLVATHADDVLNACDRVIRLRDGRLETP